MSRTFSMVCRALAPQGARSCRIAGAFLVAATLAACGGGGGGAASATVSSTAVSASRYAAPVLLTISGTSLDNITVTSAGCKNITRLTAPPTASTSTTAYYGCTASGAYSSSFTIQSNGSTVGTSNTFTVPQPKVTLTVNNSPVNGVFGNIVIALTGDTMPITVDNFLAYVNTGFYTNKIFDRIVHTPFATAQAGVYGHTVNGALPPASATSAPIALEINPTLKDTQWTIAMARGNAPNSATAEFFFNLQDNPLLDGNYAVFGIVDASSTAVVQAISDAPANCAINPQIGTNDCLPSPDVQIVSAMQTQ
jgi:cyclophilin family peptidyl-prolyl cis-trans isomerase